MAKLNEPEIYAQLESEIEALGFTMPSDKELGSLLGTLIHAKPSGEYLELGTGGSLSLSFMVEAMDENSSLISLDNDPDLIALAQRYFGHDHRVSLLEVDGEEWIRKNGGQQFDLIFADTWPGKYSLLDETIAMVKKGGFYVVDDMNPQPNWPEGHEEKAKALKESILQHPELAVSFLDCSTGILLGVKK
ncbi:O-methyltransferase [Jiulongibacter sp. NS-SX5]|uniref:O-methyltransferase n=1 Tax=Jiulongibacter sp. NS-SX5 TaxID=3463854 RepID=UPI0040598601